MKGRTFPKTAAMRLYSLVYENILEPEGARVQRKVNNLCSRNHALGARSNSIVWEGQSLTPTNRLLGVMYDPPHPTLRGEAVELIAYTQSFAKDRDYIRQVFSFLVPEVSDNQDFRDSLSDIIADYIPQLKNLPRQRPEAFHIRPHPHKMRQWYAAKERLEHYIGNLLVFS